MGIVVIKEIFEASILETAIKDPQIRAILTNGEFLFVVKCTCEESLVISVGVDKVTSFVAANGKGKEILTCDEIEQLQRFVDLHTGRGETVSKGIAFLSEPKSVLN